jgi:type VI secretion system secreted protein Hcp
MAFDAFMYVTGGAVPAVGETTDLVFTQKKAWEVQSFSFGASNPSTVGSGSGGSGGGKVTISSFNVMKRTDNASPKLFKACCMGSFYDTAVVTLRKAGGKTPLVYLVYTFTEVYVDNIQWSGSSGGDDVPAESVSFSFATVKVEYYPQKKDGTQGTLSDASWNITTNNESVSS